MNGGGRAGGGVVRWAARVVQCLKRAYYTTVVFMRVCFRSGRSLLLRFIVRRPLFRAVWSPPDQAKKTDSAFGVWEGKKLAGVGVSRRDQATRPA